MRRIRRWERRTVITVATIAVLLLAVRIAMPYVVKRFVNERLQEIPGYAGGVDDVGISVFRGAYSLDGLEIFKKAGEVQQPFFAAKHIDFSIAWRELFRRKVVSDIVVDGLELTFVQGETPQESQKDVDRRWQAVIQDLFPIDITHLEVRNGFLRYQDKTKEPHVDLFVKDLSVIARGLRNRAEEGGEEFPADIRAEGVSLGGGQFKMLLAAEPLAEQPHFHLSLNVEGVNLPDLNESLRAIANVDVGRGTFRMAAEMAGKDGGFQGYVKPFFEDLDFKNVADANKGIGSRVWEKMVSGLAWLVKNKPRDQVATRIPFQGRFGDPQVGMWRTVTNLFRHGFIRAFDPRVEGTIHADNVLPDGSSADGKDVAERAPEQQKPADVDNRAGAPTSGRGQPRAVNSP